MASTVNHSSQRGEYRPRARTLHPFVTNRVPRFTFFPFLSLFLLFSFVFLFFFSFFYKKKSRRSSDKEKSIRSINGKRKRRREGEGGFSIAFPFRSTIWRGKVRKNGCDGGDGTSSVEIPRSPPRPRGTSTTRYVQEEDIARKVERERERIVRAVAVYTGYKIRCLERLSAWSRLSAFRVRFSSFRSSPPPPCHLRFRLERNTVPSIPSELYRVVQIVP